MIRAYYTELANTYYSFRNSMGVNAGDKNRLIFRAAVQQTMSGLLKLASTAQDFRDSIRT